MQGLLGIDLSPVRLHTDNAAAASARDVNATAYTVGNHVVFGSGAHSPHTSAGQRLLAHELAHVVQQRTRAVPPWPFASAVGDADSPAEREADLVAESIGTGRGIGAANPARATAPPLTPITTGPILQRQKTPPEPGEKSTDPAKEHAEEVFAAVAAIEANWKLLAKVSRPYPLLSRWLVHGDTVVALIRSHVTSALAARQANDFVLEAAYTKAVETDKVTYDYIAWHVTAYVNLLSIRSAVDRLVDAFDNDSRAFTGRANAERITRELQKAIKGVPAHSNDALALIRTDIPLVVRPGTPSAISVTVTSPAIAPKVAALFRQSIASMQQFQANIQQGAQFVSQFVDEAFVEGLEQTAEALEEYAKVREMLGGSSKRGKKAGKGPKKKDEPETEPHPERVPRLPVPEGDEEKPPAAMRFQVQWNSRAKDPNKKGQFSETASAPASVGVSVAQAVTALRATHAKVVPRRAKDNAEPAVAAQTKWINDRPAQGGIAIGGYSKSVPFEYDYPDARVDVENQRGHNLRQ